MPEPMRVYEVTYMTTFPTTHTEQRTSLSIGNSEETARHYFTEQQGKTHPGKILRVQPVSFPGFEVQAVPLEDRLDK